jgi:hypothetical protein
MIESNGRIEARGHSQRVFLVFQNVLTKERLYSAHVLESL